MSKYTQQLQPGMAAVGDSFIWTGDGASTVVGGLGPSLGRLGPVPAMSVDLVRVAVGVYAADRTSPRSGGGSDWNQRELELEVPVSDPDRWRPVAASLESTLAFLSGDKWTLTFTAPVAVPTEDVKLAGPIADRVVLLSGGADSAVGGLLSKMSLGAGGSHVLVSHFSANHFAKIQADIAARIVSLAPLGDQTHEVVHLARRSKRPDGTDYPGEPTSRSRSFLFLSLGMALAAQFGVDLWIPENGFASINPPLGPGRRGSLSTRTTHPRFIQDFNGILRALEVPGRVINPFAGMTKGEMFRSVADQFGNEATTEYLSATNSCAMTGQRSFHVPLRIQCGVCFGCVVRRAAFTAAGLEDRTEYANRSLSDRLARWLDATSVLPAVHDFVARGVRMSDLIALSLPDDLLLKDAADLVARGSAELGKYAN